MNNVIEQGSMSVHLDFVMGSSLEQCPAVLSYFHRSLQMVKAFAANLSCLAYPLSSKGHDSYRFEMGYAPYKTFIQPITAGKEKFYHAISIAEAVNDTLLLLQEGSEGLMLYNFLMEKFDYPLMREWADELYSYFLEEGCIQTNRILCQSSVPYTETLPINGKNIPLPNVYAANISIDEGRLKECIQDLFMTKRIWITKVPQRKLQFSNMDTYFKKYGPTLVRNLEQLLHPLRELDGEANDIALKTKRLYPQQLAQVNGDVALLENNRYAILNHGMGTGKTISAAAIAESYFTRKWLRMHPGKTFQDAYADPNAVVYRNIVMCPSHLLEKWAAEIREEIPYAHVTILREFKQLVELRRRGAKRTRKEWYVISKDFGKLTYQERPVPKRRRRAEVMAKQCKHCHTTYGKTGHTCPKCGSREYALLPTGNYVTGMVCPFCNQLLVQNKNTYLWKDYDDVSDIPVLTDTDFDKQRDGNCQCYYCEEKLWQPAVSNIGALKESVWQRVTLYANKAHKGKKTIWMHRDYMDEYFVKHNESPLNIIKNTGSRKYSPVEFIKRYLKSYFDIAVFDEAHKYKGGSSGQGHAMHALIRASKKQIALTGTIAGGYANHMYYLLWRLDSARMVKNGYSYTDELKFVKKYGKMETEYEYRATGRYNDTDYKACCKGRQTSSPRVKPGISPLIFMDFLLDSTTFFDLSDLSKYLPPLKELVVTVDADSKAEEEMLREYRDVTKTLTELIRDPLVGGKSIMSSMLQFSLSYSDKPYGAEPIVSPKTGTVLCSPYDFEEFTDVTRYDNLLSKEKKLIDIINKEISEGRNCVVYAEYTAHASTCITYRLKEILELHCNLKGKVTVLESASPKASEREAWMHKKAKSGTRVFITNPRCVETGLDFCWKEDGKEYNYPTLIFYQLGYSLFTVWQASRRSYRLNQRKECRVYYMALNGTIQPKVIEMIAEKQAATSAIQGKFSTEGLAAMANGTDVRLKLAQSLSQMDTMSGNSLQDMFDVIANESGDERFDKYKPMLLFDELVAGCQKADVSLEDADGLDRLFMFDTFDLDDDSLFTEISFSELVEEEIVLSTRQQTHNSRKKEVTGQMSMFSM